eukprot:482499_1
MANYSNFQERTNFVKEAAKQVFKDEQIAKIIHDTIVEEQYEDNDAILDDLDDMIDSIIISITSNKIQKNKNIQMKWDYGAKIRLYKMLKTIYENINTDNIDLQQFMHPLLLSNQAKKSYAILDTFTTEILCIVTNLNATIMKKKNQLTL